MLLYFPTCSALLQKQKVAAKLFSYAVQFGSEVYNPIVYCATLQTCLVFAWEAGA